MLLFKVLESDLVISIALALCLSRLMKEGVGEGKTRNDHQNVSSQLYSAYSRALELRALAEIVGKAGLAPNDIKYLEFGDLFEEKFLKQGFDENRTLEDTLGIAWDLFSTLPTDELTKVKQDEIDSYLKVKE